MLTGWSSQAARLLPSHKLRTKCFCLNLGFFFKRDQFGCVWNVVISFSSCSSHFHSTHCQVFCRALVLLPPVHPFFVCDFKAVGTKYRIILNRRRGFCYFSKENMRLIIKGSLYSRVVIIVLVATPRKVK